MKEKDYSKGQNKGECTWNRKEGITLIALVITIIILVILATMTFYWIFGSDGLINRTNEAKEMANINTILEELQLEKADLIIELNKDGIHEITVDDYLEHIKDNEIITDEDIIYTEEGYAEIEIDDYVFSLTEKEDGDLEIKYLGNRDNLGPRIKEIKVTSYSNKLKVDIESIRNDGGTFEYFIKQAEEEEYESKGTSQEATFTFEGLTQETEYDIKVIAKNTKNLSHEKETKGTTIKTQSAQENIILESLTWNKNTHTATATLKKVDGVEEGYSIQYNINNTESGWQDGDTPSGLNHGDELYYRLYDGTNVGDYGQTTIEDNALPQNATITLSDTTSFMNSSSTTATVTQVDNESGVDITKCKWIFTTQATAIGTDESSYTNSFTQNGQTITITGTQAGNFYLHVLTVDFAGNKRETISSAVLVKDAKAASNLKPGDYIYYDPGTRSYTSPSSTNGMRNQTYNSGNYKGTWRVLTNNGSSVTIIPSFSVDNFQVKGQAGYNNFISELNKICQIYIHPTYATSARIVQYSDVSLLTSLGTLNIGNTYWLGDRFSEEDDIGRTFYYARTVVSGGAVQNSWIYYRTGSGTIVDDTPAFDIRPIVTIKPDALLERGSGSSDDYYYLR